MSNSMDDKVILKELRDITKDKGCWKANIDNIAEKLDTDYSIAVRAKALWLLGEMGLMYPEEIEGYVEDIVGNLDGMTNPKTSDTHSSGHVKTLLQTIPSFFAKNSRFFMK